MICFVFYCIIAVVPLKGSQNMMNEINLKKNQRWKKKRNAMKTVLMSDVKWFAYITQWNGGDFTLCFAPFMFSYAIETEREKERAIQTN